MTNRLLPRLLGASVLGVAFALALSAPALAQERLTTEEYYQDKERPGLADGSARVALGATMNLSESSLADALDLPSGAIVSADFGTSDVTSYGIFSIGAGGFPVEGGEYVVLSSGRAENALVPGLFASTSLSNQSEETGQDITQLTLTLNVPQGAETLRFDARVGSEEFPAFVGDSFNDFVLVETPTSTFTIDDNLDVIAPNNVAVDQEGNLISINTSGPTAFSFEEGAGTAFNGCDGGLGGGPGEGEGPGDGPGEENFVVTNAVDEPETNNVECTDDQDTNGGATPLLTQIVPIPGGAQTITIVISVGDQGDNIYDTAVFLDNFRFSGLGGGGTIASCPETLFISDFATGEPESLSLLNFSDDAEDLSGCTIVAFNPFTERVISSTNLDGTTVGAGETLVFDGFDPNSLRDMFGAIAVINGPEVAVGSSVQDVLGSIVAAIVYVNENTIVGQTPASPGDTPTRTRGGTASDALVSALTTLRAEFGTSEMELQVGPNPFRDRAVVSLSLPDSGPVRLAVYDVLGRQLAVIADGTVLDAGVYQFAVGGDLPAGTYVVRAEAGRHVRTVQLVRTR